MTAGARRVRIALDLLGGDHAPEAVAAGALQAVANDPDVDLTLVGPPEVTDRLRVEHTSAIGDPGRISSAPARQVVTMGEDPARAVRAKRDATVRVAARLVRDGAADATVSVGPTGAAMAAALFSWGRLPGVTRPGLAAVIPAAHGPTVLLDAGANTEAGADLLAQFALAGSAYASARFGLSSPRVGLLSIGVEPGKGDDLRRTAHALLVDLPIHFVGNVEGSEVPQGEAADVVVTDGLTGNVLLKGLEGTYSLLVEAVRRGSPEALRAAIDDAVGHLAPDRLGGAVLLGVDGVAVVGHGAATPRAVASCIEVAAQAVREEVVPTVRASLADLVDRRRLAAGFAPRPGSIAGEPIR